MKDLVPKGTGNSRFLRSSIPSNITHEELVALLRAGTFPVDFAGLNADGVAVVGSAYNKANVLPDDICSLLGVSTSAEPKDAFSSLLNKINSFSQSVKGRIVIGTYDGDNSKPKTISLGFTPICVFVYDTANSLSTSKTYFGFCCKGYPLIDRTDSGLTSALSIKTNGFSVLTGDVFMLNQSGAKYAYFAVKEV